MSLITLSSIASSLTVRFRDEVEKQINRATVLLQVLPKGNGTTGKRLDWAVSFGTSVGAARNEGADVSGDGNHDTKAPATLEFGNYDDHFTVTGKAIRGAAAAGNPAQLANLFGESMGDCITRLAKGIAQGLYDGTGATNFIHGLTATAGPLQATGEYANIDRATYPQWAANVYTNSGVPRSLTKPLMRSVRRGIYEASGMRPDLIVCSPAVHEAYGNTFQLERRYVQEIVVRGQKIVLDGGWAVLEFDGIPVIEDVDCSDEMLFLNTSVMAVRQLPDIGAGLPGDMSVELRGTPEEQFGAQSANITARVIPCASSGDYRRFQLISYPQLQARRCNALGRLGDLAV